MDEMFEMLGIAVAAIVLVIVALSLCAGAGEVVKWLGGVVAQRRQDRETRRKALPVLPEAGREYWVHFPAAEGYELACYTGEGTWYRMKKSIQAPDHVKSAVRIVYS